MAGSCSNNSGVFESQQSNNRHPMPVDSRKLPKMFPAPIDANYILYSSQFWRQGLCSKCPRKSNDDLYVSSKTYIHHVSLVSQSGCSLTFHGLIPLGLAVRLSAACSITRMLSGVVINRRNSCTSRFAALTELENSRNKTSAVWC